MPMSWVDLDVNGETMEAYLTRPDGPGPFPAVIVVQEIWGVNSHIQSVTGRLPAQGYVGISPALFHREGSYTLTLYEEMDASFANLGRLTDVNILADLRAVIAYLQSLPFVQSDRIGITGFCVGGRISYLAASNLPEIKAAVNFYGGRSLVAFGDGKSPVEQTANITAPILGLFGGDDGNPTPEDVATIEAELKKHSKEYEFHSYPGCGHGFHCDERSSYRREAAMDAWGKAVGWFDKYLKV